MNRKLLITLAALLSGAFAAPRAHAAGGLYLGAGIGRSTVKDETLSGEFDTSDAAYKAFAGYRFDMIPFIDLAGCLLPMVDFTCITRFHWSKLD
jgi:hypothetical protein